jgi:hypothetical protein
VNLQNLRWPVVVAVMAAALMLLFGGGFVLKSRTVEEPLKMLYNGSPVVEKSELVRDGDGYAITLKLKDTPDLSSAYGNLDSETRKVLKEIPYTIKVQDSRDAALEQIYNRVNLYVQEALATGQFATMADKVDQEAAKAGMSARFAVDNDRVYLQMKDEDGYLYSVVDRPHAQSAAKPAAEGGMGL